MKVTMFVSRAVALLALSSMSAIFAENDVNWEDAVAKLTEHLTKMSNELSALSNKQTDQYNQLTNQQADLTKKLNSFKGTSTAGPTFIRWGRKSCEETNSGIIYSGVAAGEHVEAQGGGANLLCLPRDPTFGNYDSVDRYGLELFVAEYNINSADNYPFEHNDPLLFDNDVPCAVCEVTNGSSVMMIPGRADCYSDWRMEYRGYLVTAASGDGHMGYICVDAKPEADYSGDGPATKALRLSPVEANCDAPSLPCPPYSDHWEISCVVCSK